MYFIVKSAWKKQKKNNEQKFDPWFDLCFDPQNEKANNVKWPANFSYGLLPLFNSCLPYTRHYYPLLIINRGFQDKISFYST